MSVPFSETVSHALEKVHLSPERILSRLSQFALSIMNFAVRLLQLFCITLLYFSAVKSAYIPKESGGSTHDALTASRAAVPVLSGGRDCIFRTHRHASALANTQRLTAN